MMIKFNESFPVHTETLTNVEDLNRILEDDIRTAGDSLGMRNPSAQCMICLLYTSPSPRDLSTSRMPSSA